MKLKVYIKYLKSWADSHIIDCLTSTNVSLWVIYIISFLLLIFLSPLLTMFLLIGCSIYFCYKSNYKNIVKIWGFFIVSWYLLFTVYLVGFDAPIVIGAVESVECIECDVTVLDETSKLMFFVSDTFTSSTVKDFCGETILLLVFVSNKLKITIYVPSVFKGIIFLLKFIFEGRGGGTSVDCSPEDEGKGFSSKSSKKDTESFLSSLFKSNEKKGDEVECDPCADLKILLRKNRGKLDVGNMESGVDKNRFLYYGELRFPFKEPFFTACVTRDLTKNERQNNK